MKYLAIFSILLCAACTTTHNYSTGDINKLNRNADYSIIEREDGFTIAIQYSRYQMIPETSAIVEACKSELLSSAYDFAESKGHKIQTINEQRIKLSTGRNGLLGITSCSASVPVTYTD